MLAAILAFGSACPVLAEFQDSGMLFIEGLEDAQLQLPEGPGDDGIVIDGLGDRLEALDVSVAPAAASGISPAGSSSPLRRSSAWRISPSGRSEVGPGDRRQISPCGNARFNV